ncbi:nucleoside triphosphate pyrophosphohydrolase family protein [Novosphingobium sp. Gsoil 351]|uniref:nucleoside triphosphate pyrophosphohydrolase family protein n=1 Tax=Novosphingobium sp. Gsoil 351 TaxID=2675225 RepID=UPI0012B4AD5F|nr:nucleoside triphosphate pyrophosphohydrolase family protein [Novosphingobium sp. Gsoil 351]QGN55916.1 pyrophosphatase [Novosphingobium sp. Gsoil 351]
MTPPPYDAPALREGNLTLDVYQQFAVATDRSARSGERRLRFHLLGLFGEVGSLLSELKKKQRDHNSYAAYERSSVEETGDVLWYLANVADALNLRLSDLAARPDSDPSLFGCSSAPTSFHDLEGQQSLGLMSPASGEYVERSLLDVAARVGRLIRRANETTEGADALREDLSRLFHSLVTAAADAQISLESSARSNIEKVEGRWPIERVHTPLFDEDYDDDERLPRQLEVVFREKEVLGVKYVFQSVHGVNLGDRLTDNSADQDDYRFHDVFHLAYAAVLGWSPVLRALLKLKRKSNRAVDEQQDGARAIITEEGISNWIFSHGLRHQAFADVTSLDFELLRTIHQMVRGYEVQRCPMWMWEDAILQGFTAFRYLREHRAGTFIADLEARRLIIKEGVTR